MVSSLKYEHGINIGNTIVSFRDTIVFSEHLYVQYILFFLSRYYLQGKSKVLLAKQKLSLGSRDPPRVIK